MPTWRRLGGASALLLGACLGCLRIRAAGAERDALLHLHGARKLGQLEDHINGPQQSRQQQRQHRIELTSSATSRAVGGSHRASNGLATAGDNSEVPQKVWAFWFGGPMTGKRLVAWQHMKQHLGVDVELVTDDTLHKYNISDAPFHRALALGSMSANHKADYFRAYFMHHYGGGYSDVKPVSQSWRGFFDLFRDPEVWMVGAPENQGGVACDESYVNGDWCSEKQRAAGVAEEDLVRGVREWAASSGPCCAEVRSAWEKLASNQMYIIRPGTSLTGEWLSMIHAHLDAKYDALTKTKAPTPRCCYKHVEGYPIRWAELAGEAFGPSQYKYSRHILRKLPPYGAGGYLGDEFKPEISGLF